MCKLIELMRRLIMYVISFKTRIQLYIFGQGDNTRDFDANCIGNNPKYKCILVYSLHIFSLFYNSSYLLMATLV